MKKEKVKAVLSLMEVMGITIDDLCDYKNSIEITKKFPLEVYFCDRTSSSDVEHYYVGRFPVGVLIDDTIYGLPSRAVMVECGATEKFCELALGYELKGTLPTIQQAKKLTQNLKSYNDIADFFNEKPLAMGMRKMLAVANPENNSQLQHYYNFEKDVEGSHNGKTLTLPVINL